MLSKDNIINLEDFRVRDTKTGAISKVLQEEIGENLFERNQKLIKLRAIILLLLL